MRCVMKNFRTSESASTPYRDVSGSALVERSSTGSTLMDTKTDSVSITLSSQQIARVVLAATQDGNPSISFTNQLADLLGREALVAGLENPHLSQSLMRGMFILVHLRSIGDWVSISDLASEMDMTRSTAHRYLATLLAIGLIEQDPRSRKYRLPRT
jgi:Fic family protein